ncbi:PTS transporter subunit EIIC [Mycoplasma marinum]|uniref:PTS transporter subunit EIIC n=1 Tax=Mycoplasma marinum TaxID=1937190 RepID=UPI001FE9C58E|nr:PTS transporter subunit EIIC [Mycoplasma marinum]
MTSIARNDKKSKSLKPKKKNLGILAGLQRIGKALLFPIAMMPMAAILLRVGAQIGDATAFASFVHAFIQGSGDAVFGALPFLFAIGVAFGLAKDSRGEAAITGFVIMVLMTVLMSTKGGKFGNYDMVDKIYGTLNLGGGNGGTGFHSLFGNKYNAILAENVLNGIVVGGLIAFIYNKFNGIELPSVLGFFSGRRLIPVLSFIIGTMFIVLWAIIFPWIGYTIYQLSNAMQKGAGNRWANAGIMGAYGILNRLLIPFGLHHIPNTLFWFQLGDYQSVTGGASDVHGDIFGFLNAAAVQKDSSGALHGLNAGTFQSGFFPIMMFGLPALAVAFWFNADGDVQKKRVASLLFGSAIVSFFTGITEPIEFSFLFLAPALFGMHAILTGVFGFITGIFGIQLGFGFSAGLVDYALSIPKSMQIIDAHVAYDGWSGIQRVMANPAWIFVIGAAAAATYFSLATLLIRKFNISSPGRGSNKIEKADAEDMPANIASGDNKYTKDAKTILEGIGGSENIEHLEWCATRLRFTLKDSSKINDAQVKKTIAMGDN